MSQGANWEALLSQGDRRGQAGRPAGLAASDAGSALAREERALAALLRIIAALREQGTAEEELFAAVVVGLGREVAGEG